MSLFYNNPMARAATGALTHVTCDPTLYDSVWHKLSLLLPALKIWRLDKYFKSIFNRVNKLGLSCAKLSSNWAQLSQVRMERGDFKNKIKLGIRVFTSSDFWSFAPNSEQEANMLRLWSDFCYSCKKNRSNGKCCKIQREEKLIYKQSCPYFVPIFASLYCLLP